MVKLIDGNDTLSMDRDFWWAVNIYDLTAMPLSIRVDLTTQKEQSTGEVFRDMRAVVPELTANDVDIV